MTSKQTRPKQSSAFPSDTLPFDQFLTVSNIVPAAAAAASNATAAQSKSKPSTNIQETLETDKIYISDSEQLNTTDNSAILEFSTLHHTPTDSDNIGTDNLTLPASFIHSDDELLISTPDTDSDDDQEYTLEQILDPIFQQTLHEQFLQQFPLQPLLAEEKDDEDDNPQVYLPLRFSQEIQI